jgi:SPP1 gp7 family putative phage head morphogenesis protein
MPVNPAIDKIAARLEPSLARAFLAAVATLQSGVNGAGLQAALKAGNLAEAVRAILEHPVSASLAPAAEVVREVFTRAGAATAATLPRVTMRFDMQNPLAAKAARQTGALLVRQVSLETKAGIRALISRSFADGLPPVKTARLIRGMVGLTERQAQAVMNARAAWAEAGLTGDVLDGKVERYAAKLLRQRAKNIARSESVAAANAGQLAAWQQAADSGLIQPERTQRVWSASAGERTCDRCAELDGEAVAFDEPFSNGKMGAPEHPSCRCSIFLKFTR